MISSFWALLWAASVAAAFYAGWAWGWGVGFRRGVVWARKPGAWPGRERRRKHPDSLPPPGVPERRHRAPDTAKAPRSRD